MSYEVATDMVRQAFVKEGYEAALFDAWLAGVLHEERERIINLIGDKFECIQHYDCEPLINITCSEMYALIKGEQK